MLVVSLAIALVVAFVKNRYEPRIYPVSASILIKEDKQTSGAELIYSNDLTNQYRNYYNEVYIIRSYPLIQSVLEELNFGVTFSREGNILTRELYGYPVKTIVLNKEEVMEATFFFTILNEKQFELKYPIQGAVQNSEKFAFNDTIVFQNLKVVFQVRDLAGIESHRNRPFIFRYSAPEERFE